MEANTLINHMVDRLQQVNEIVGIVLASTFPLTIPNLQPRLQTAFATLSADPAALDRAIGMLEEIAQACADLIARP